MAGMAITVMAQEKSVASSTDAAETPSATSAEEAQIQTLQEKRHESLVNFRAALKSEPDSARRAALATAFVEQDAKERRALAALVATRRSEQPAAAPIPVEQRVEGISNEKVKAALIARYRAQDELAALREQTKALSPEARAKKYAAWQKKYDETLSSTARTLKAEAKTETSSQPSLPAEPPASLSEKGKAAWTQRAALTQDLAAMGERTKNLSPGERSRAYAQWFAQNETTLEKARRELSQERRSSQP